MKVLVINLDSATARMEFQHKQLQQLSLKYERLSACQIKDKTDEIYLKYHATWQRPLSLAEVSCYFSHKIAWDKVIEAGSPMLILEDDALLAESVPNLLDELDKLKNIDYVNLEARGHNQKKQLAQKATQHFGDIEMVRLFQGRSGAAGYVIWPSGAKKLMAKMLKEGIAIADKFINSEYKLLAYQIEPAVIIQLDQCQLYGITCPIVVNTSIGERPTFASINSRMFWVYNIKRIIGELKVGLNQLQNSHRSTRRSVEISGAFIKTKSDV
jgi:glycosyl transferase family 25